MYSAFQDIVAEVEDVVYSVIGFVSCPFLWSEMFWKQLENFVEIVSSMFSFERKVKF
jgi:hypothetical protein